MATINGKGGMVQQGVYRVVWAAVGDADQGTPEQLSRFPLKSVQFGEGAAASPGNTFGGATVVLQGTDEEFPNADTLWFTLDDVDGASVSATSANRFDLQDVPLHVRPSTTGGTSSDINVIITAKHMQ